MFWYCVWHIIHLHKRIFAIFQYHNMRYCCMCRSLYKDSLGQHHYLSAHIQPVHVIRGSVLILVVLYHSLSTHPTGGIMSSMITVNSLARLCISGICTLSRPKQIISRSSIVRPLSVYVVFSCIVVSVILPPLLPGP